VKEKRGHVAPVVPPVVRQSPPLVSKSPEPPQAPQPQQPDSIDPPEVIFTSHPSFSGYGVILAARTPEGFRAYTLSRANANALINSMTLQLAMQWISGPLVNEAEKDEATAAAEIMASDTTILTRVGVPQNVLPIDPFDDPENVMSGEPVTDIASEHIALSSVGSIEYFDDIPPVPSVDQHP